MPPDAWRNKNRVGGTWRGWTCDGSAPQRRDVLGGQRPCGLEHAHAEAKAELMGEAEAETGTETGRRLVLRRVLLGPALAPPVPLHHPLHRPLALCGSGAFAPAAVEEGSEAKAAQAVGIDTAPSEPLACATHAGRHGGVYAPRTS